LLKDPVFQLNLLLWMTREQPVDNYRVRPLFYEWGFEIIYIEHPFPFPEEVTKAIKGSELDIGEGPEPELILGRQTDSKALYFEAKADSFGIKSTNCRQARAHLIASGPVFREVLSPLSDCLLCYVVPANACAQMSACLTGLAEELQGMNLEPGSFSCHGLAVRGQRVIYSWDSRFKIHAGVEADEFAILDNFPEDTDPSPLMIVFSDEDCSNPNMRDFYRRAVVDQVRACLLCDLHSHALGAQYKTSSDNLLAKTTDGFLHYLGRNRQKALRRLVRENIFKKIADYWEGKKPKVKLDGDELTIGWDSLGDKESFLNWLEDKRTRFGTGLPQDNPMPLFDSLDAKIEEN
jgi:hypothetical protein